METQIQMPTEVSARLGAPYETQYLNDYGLMTANKRYELEDGTTIPSEDEKVILRFRAGQKPREIKTVSTRYALLPNELALQWTEEAARQAGFKLLPKNGIRTARHGNFVRAFYVSEKFSFEAKVGDTIQLGFAMRNSIDASSGFAFDGFSFRLACSNGLVHMVSDFGSVRRKHIGDPIEMKKELNEFVGNFSFEMSAIANFYRLLAKTEMTQEIADAIASKIPSKYLPKYIVKERGNPRVTYQHNANRTAFEVLNDVTEVVWHQEAQDKPLDQRSIDLYTNNTMAAVRQVITPTIRA